MGVSRWRATCDWWHVLQVVEGKKREEEMQSKYDATKAEVAEAMAAFEKAKQQAS